jgi:hypothetical protein
MHFGNICVKYKCDSIILFLFFLFTENRDMAISRESYSFKIILRSSFFTLLTSLLIVLPSMGGGDQYDSNDGCTIDKSS